MSGMTEAGRGGRCGAPMSPVSSAGGGIDVPVPVRKAGDGGAAGGRGRGRFATDFEVKEVIGTGSFGTVYKVGCGGLFFAVPEVPACRLLAPFFFSVFSTASAGYVQPVNVPGGTVVYALTPPSLLPSILRSQNPHSV